MTPFLSSWWIINVIYFGSSKWTLQNQWGMLLKCSNLRIGIPEILAIPKMFKLEIFFIILHFFFSEKGLLDTQFILLNPSLKHLLDKCLYNTLIYSLTQRYVAYLTSPQYNKLGLKDQGTHLEKYVVLLFRWSISFSFNVTIKMLLKARMICQRMTVCSHVCFNNFN